MAQNRSNNFHPQSEVHKESESKEYEIKEFDQNKKHEFDVHARSKRRHAIDKTTQKIIFIKKALKSVFFHSY